MRSLNGTDLSPASCNTLALKESQLMSLAIVFRLFGVMNNKYCKSAKVLQVKAQRFKVNAANFIHKLSFKLQLGPFF